jgi:GTP-binding protein
MMPKVAIVGRPNVGKSTIFNRIIGDRIAITDDQPGATRDRIYGHATWLSHTFSLIDTGGIELSDAPFLSQIKAQAELAISESDLVLFVCDVQGGIHPDDQLVMKLLFAAEKPVIVVVNKADNETLQSRFYEFYELGAEHVIAVSASHGIGFGDLLDRIVDLLPEKTEEPYAEDTIRIAIIGRPNVGKSTLTNAILGFERVITSAESGTTTDSIDTLFQRDGKEYVVIDTAGIRKRGKVFEGIEKYSVLRAMQAIERSDVCLLVLDASTGIQEQDKHIAGYALENDKALILVFNKYDQIPKTNETMSEWTRKIRQEFPFLSYVPIAFISALTASRIPTLFPLIDKVYENYSRRVQTAALNEVITEAMLLNPPKMHNQHLLKVYYTTQVTSKCPTFILFVNYAKSIHFSYQRYLENRLRERFDFEGTPIKLILRNRE